jgi:hypothetical protein
MRSKLTLLMAASFLVGVPYLFALPPTITGVNAFWWLGSGITDDGSGCPSSSPCYYAQAAWTAHANGATGTPTWHVNTVAGGGNVSLSCTFCSSTTATSTAPSNGCVYDVKVYVTYPDGNESSPTGFEVSIVKPKTLTLEAGYPTDADSPFGTGYESATAWNLTDSCGYSDAGLDVNEVFGTFTNDYSGANWTQPTPSYANEPTSTVTDYMIATYAAGQVPPAEDPQTPLGSTKVRHNPRTIYVGSITFGSGVAVLTDTQQNYQDHGRHQ